jgi:hypothetical protein
MVGPVEVQVVIDRQYLCDSCLIEHLIDPLGDHAQQLVFVAVSEPEDQRVAVSKLMGVLLIVVTDLAVFDDNPF